MPPQIIKGAFPAAPYNNNYGRKFELSIPQASTLSPLLIILHGFQGNLKYHLGTAELLREQNVAVLCAELHPLMGWTQKSRAVLRETNCVSLAEDIVNYICVEFKSKVDVSRIILAGHSAGGAVAIETVVELIKRNQASMIKGLLLLDAVPWVSTVRKGKEFKSYFNCNVEQYPCPADGGRSADSICTLSLRGEEDSFNANGLIQEQFRAFGFPITDLKILGARHGDFMRESALETVENKYYKRSIMKSIVGLLSTKENQDLIQYLIIDFCRGIFYEENKPMSELKQRVQQHANSISCKIVWEDWELPKLSVPFFML